MNTIQTEIPTASVTVAFTITGDPRIHESSCGHLERRQALTAGNAKVLSVATRTELAAALYAGPIAESEGLTAEDFADELGIEQCAVHIPHGAPDAHRRWTRARREQGFRSSEHLQAFNDYYDHTQACAECGTPGKSVLTDEGWQETAVVCPEGRRLDAITQSFSRYR